ncbi:MAG: tetratricopeptide repeat protein, partial [Actinomycetota bacterium]
RSAVLARLCPPLNLFGTTDDAVASGREALALAEELGDPRLIGSALDGLSWALAVPAHTPERVDVIERLIQVAKQLGDEWLEVNAHLQRAQILLEMGRADALTEEIARYDLHAPGPHEDFFVWWGSALRASRAFMLGRFDDVELELAALRDVGDRGGSMTYGVTAWLDAALGWALGDADRIAAAATDIVSFVPIPAFRQGIEVFVATAAGDRTRAQEAFASVAANDFTGIPVNYIWCSVLAGMAWCAPFAATGEATEKLYALLEPYPRRVPLMPPIGFVTTSHWLGVLAAKLGRVDTARAHFEEALTLHTTLGARPWLACTLSEYGVMLLEHGDEDERVRAIDMLHDALAVADGLGMAPVASRARAALGPHATAPAGPAREYAPGNTFRPEGEWWTVSFRGRISRLNGTKGLAYLRTLLAAPGREVHVLQLVGADDAMTSAGPGDALLDDKARVAYRERIADLRADIDDAEAFSDTERAARARAELDTITEQLASATGLGGRDRRSASATERARVNVTRAIKAALMRIQAVDPALAEHLTVLVRTGTFCSYATDPSDPVLWTTLESGPD